MADPIPAPSVDEVCRRANDVIARLTGPPKTRTCPTLCRSPPATSASAPPDPATSSCAELQPRLGASMCADMLAPRTQPEAYRPTPFLRPSPFPAATPPARSGLAPAAPCAQPSTPGVRRLGPGATPSSCGRPSRLGLGVSPRPSPLRSNVDVGIASTAVEGAGVEVAAAGSGQPPSAGVSDVSVSSAADAAVVLSNLAPETREGDLRAAFEPLAPIVRIDMSPPLARIEFVHPDAAERAVAIYHHSWLCGQRIVVARAGASAPPTPTPTSTPASCASLKHAHEDDELADPKRPRLEPVAAI